MPRPNPIPFSFPPATRGWCVIARLPLLASLASLAALLAACTQEPVAVEWKAPLVVDTVRERCLAVSPADAAEFRQVTPRPPHWPAKGAAKRELQAHIDTLERDVTRKNDAGQRVGGELTRCRRDAGAPQS